jgi:hypothetical protein
MFIRITAILTTIDWILGVFAIKIPPQRGTARKFAHEVMFKL